MHDANITHTSLYICWQGSKSSEVSIQEMGIQCTRIGKYMYSGPSILQPFILRPNFGPKVQFSVLLNLYFKTTCNIRPHFHGPMGGL